MGVTLKGHIDVPAERLGDIRAALQEHIRLSRAEAGCLSFDVAESKASPGRFEVSERFVDSAAFDAHQKRTQASAWAKVTAGLPRHYTTTGYRE